MTWAPRKPGWLDKPPTRDAPSAQRVQQEKVNLVFVEAAAAIVRIRYPSDRYQLRRETPKLILCDEDCRAYRNGKQAKHGAMIPDIGVFSGSDLIAVVEVGNLSRPDKLHLLKKYLPDAEVWWIPFSDLLAFYSPDYEQFRLVPKIDKSGIRPLASFEAIAERLNLDAIGYRIPTKGGQNG